MNHSPIAYVWLAILLGLLICLCIGGWLAMRNDDNTK